MSHRSYSVLFEGLTARFSQWSEILELSEVERWLVDLVRVGASGNSSGVVQLGRRLIRKTPSGITNVEAFRAEVGQCLLAASQAQPVRGVPVIEGVEGEGGLPMLTFEESPDPEEPVVEASLHAAFQRLIEERFQWERLASAGLEPTAKVLLTGPPGVGKTMAARFLAARLGRPLLTLDLAAVMSSLLGQSGQNLRQAFDYARQSGGVLFLDEFDAVAKYRDDKSDLGELKRLVNIILLTMDQWDSEAMLVAATNHPELLDRAVSRRFDLVLDMPLPGDREREALVVRQASRYTDVGEWPPGGVNVLVALTEGMSGSELERLSQASARAEVLEQRPYFAALFESVLHSRGRDAKASLSGELREVACYAAADLLGWSNRKTAAVLDLSHPTVGKARAAYEAKQLAAQRGT